MHLHTRIFKAAFVLAVVLCLFVGCTSVDADMQESVQDAVVITARRQTEREVSAETPADERENLSFFDKSETQNTDAATTAATTDAATTDAATTDVATAAATVTDAASAAETAAATKAPATSAAEDAPTANAGYVCNKNSKKFHPPTCSSVDKMKPANRMNYSGSRDDLLAKGYSPCQRCKP